METCRKGGGKSPTKAGKGKGDRKTQGSVLPCWYHNSKKHKKTKPCPFGENCRFSHTAISYADFCNMPVPPSAASEEYTSDSNVSAAQRVRSTRTQEPKAPFVKHCIAFKNGDCAKGESCGFPHFNATERAANKIELAEQRDNGENNVESNGKTKGKAKGKGKANATIRYALCSHCS